MAIMADMRAAFEAAEKEWNERPPMASPPVGEYCIVHWNGQWGLTAGPYCDTWQVSQEYAEAKASDLRDGSKDGWFARVRVMTCAEYFQLLDENQ